MDTHTQTHSHEDAQMWLLTHLLVLRFTQTKLWAAVSSGFCILEPKEGWDNPGCHIDTQQSSADFSGSWHGGGYQQVLCHGDFEELSVERGKC